MLALQIIHSEQSNEPAPQISYRVSAATQTESCRETEKLRKVDDGETRSNQGTLLPEKKQKHVPRILELAIGRTQFETHQKRPGMQAETPSRAPGP